MKTTIKILSLLVIVLLSSCGSNMLIVKRKYNKGFYVNTGGKVKNHETPVVKAESEDIISAAGENETIVSEEAPITASIDNSIVIARKENSFSSIKTKKLITSQSSNAISQNESKANLKVQKVIKHKRSVSNQTILLVILAIIPFLSLIAMYIKDGNQITLNFWVDLLLHLTVNGYAIF